MPVSETDDILDILRTFWRGLWRLFVLAPEEAQPLPALLKAPINILAKRLEIPDNAPFSAWLSRIFLLSPVAASQQSTVPLTGFRTWLVQLLRPVVRLLLLPWTLVQKRLDAVDYDLNARTMERWSDQVSHATWFVHGSLIGLVLLGFYLAVTTPLSMMEQFLFFLSLWIVSMWLRRIPGNLPTLLLMTISLIATCRYAWWRLTQTLDLNTTLEYLFGGGLILAESYTWLIIFLGYLQSAWPLKRQSATLPEDRSSWPTVDIYIPTYNEPLRVVKPTIFATQGIDWPRDKLNIYILDDGRRPEFREFAEQTGVHYLTRPDNSHAKAGNLNHALSKTQGEFIAIFDCDHIPVRSFLTVTMGWMLRDSRCAVVQTPHHFFSPDPFERNLETFRRVPNEGSLFYGLVQDGNDLWNATFFCGSCAVIRRKPLEEVGGIAVETVTEDSHTALKMHRRGYNTAYLNSVQAAGLATESLSGHIGQRIRWARGMAQIFRLDNPLLGKGLSLYQRLCYSNAMLHFFNGLPRLVFLTAPLSYLYFEAHIINASAIMIGLYVLPHLVQANLANSHMQGRYRHSFWAEVYESVLAWYITLPTTVALINPQAGKFNVTAKGGLIKETFFDWSISKPYLFMVALNIGGLVIGVLRLFYWNTFEQATVLMNLAWTLHNVIMLGTAVSVSVEARQVRVAHRVSMTLPVKLYLPDGGIRDATTVDYSIAGFGLLLPEGLDLAPGDKISVELQHIDGPVVFPVVVTNRQNRLLGVRMEPLSLELEKRLVQSTFGRPDAWVDWNDQLEPDRPLRSLGEVLIFGLKGYVHLLRRSQNLFTRREQPAAST